MAPQMPAGDPTGRRIARRRSLLLAEAGRLSAQLEVLLRRAGASEASAAGSLTRRIADLEQSELLRSYGRIEPRTRFRQAGGQGNPVREEREIITLFVDESGTPQRAHRANDAWFSLGAVAMSREQLEAYRRRADEIKRQFFRDPNGVIFHDPHLRHGDDVFAFRGDTLKQQELNEAVNRLIQESDYVAFGVGIRKKLFENLSDGDHPDPYLPGSVYGLALHLLLERFLDFLADRQDRPLGAVTIEAQGPKEDAAHQLSVVETILDGTQWIPGRAFQQYVRPGVEFLPKLGSHPLELSDMFARDIFEWIRAECSVEPARWQSFGPQIHQRGDMRMGKFGLKIFPDSDIRDAIEAHRDSLKR